MGRILFKLIQQNYTPDRILRILDNRYKLQKFKTLSGSDFRQDINHSLIQELLDNVDATKYDVNVSESSYSPTKQIAKFTVWSELARNRQEIPIQMLIAMDPDLGEKEKSEFLAILQRNAEIQAQSEQTNVDSEIAKTQIAAESRITTELIKQEGKAESERQNRATNRQEDRLEEN